MEKLTGLTRWVCVILGFRESMYVKVEVRPESWKESCERRGVDTFEVRVREKPKGGAANIRVCEIVRQHFPHAKRLYIVSGHHSRHKIISIDEY